MTMDTKLYVADLDLLENFVASVDSSCPGDAPPPLGTTLYRSLTHTD
jgi:hypothetical protein